MSKSSMLYIISKALLRAFKRYIICRVLLLLTLNSLFRMMADRECVRMLLRERFQNGDKATPAARKINEMFGRRVKRGNGSNYFAKDAPASNTRREPADPSASAVGRSAEGSRGSPMEAHAN